MLKRQLERYAADLRETFKEERARAQELRRSYMLTVRALASGYPRFVVHPFARQLAARLQALARVRRSQEAASAAPEGPRIGDRDQDRQAIRGILEQRHRSQRLSRLTVKHRTKTSPGMSRTRHAG